MSSNTLEELGRAHQTLVDVLEEAAPKDERQICSGMYVAAHELCVVLDKFWAELAKHNR